MAEADNLPEAGPKALLTLEEANALVVECRPWAESIARAVARAWSLDWQLDGLDGAALEALIFCSRRFDTNLGVPFKGYARKRVHEASAEAAKKSRGWRRNYSKKTPEAKAAAISYELYKAFPELRSGELPEVEGKPEDTRASIQQMLVGASLIAAKHEIEDPSPSQETLLDIRKMIAVMVDLDPVHQLLLWKIYWEGSSLRNLAAEWGTDGLNVIREHQTLVEYMHKHLSMGKKFLEPPKVRPGLKKAIANMDEKTREGAFKALANY